MADWETFFLDVIKGKRQGIIPFLIKIPLHLLSWIYGGIVTIRNVGYNRGWLKQHVSSVPVISIGNISSGGTGKTPVTLYLAKAFEKKYQIAILSRGYRSQVEKLKVPVALSQGKGPVYSAAYCGDEPYLLAENLPKAHLFVGRDRLKSSSMAAKAGADLIILDDGMQHRKLARDYEVVVIDARDPFGQGYYLPRGLLREGAKSLSRADFIVLNHVSDSSMFNALKCKLSNFTSAPMIGTRMQKERIIDLNGNEIESVKEMSVGVFCGIANPQYFHQTVEELGAHIVAHKFYPDHKFGSGESIIQFAKECKNLGASMLLCTEKDKVKFQELPEISLPIFWVKMTLELVEGEESWNDFIKKINDSLRLTGK